MSPPDTAFVRDAIAAQLHAALWECCAPAAIALLQHHRLPDLVAPLLLEDALAFAAKDPASRGDALHIVQSYTSFRAVLHHRLAFAMDAVATVDAATGAELAPFGPLVSSRGKMLSGAELHHRCRIGRRFVLDHGVGTVFGETAIVGDDCYVLGGVTLGASGIAGNVAGPRHPRLGHRCQVGAHTRIFGPVHVGDDVFIGPHCTVTEDVPAGSRVTLRSSLQVVRPAPSSPATAATPP